MTIKQDPNLTKEMIDIYLKKGYQLTISYSRCSDKLYGLLALYTNPSRIEDMIEIDIESLLAEDSKLKECLKDSYRHFGFVSYDFSNEEFTSKIIKEVTEGPYCEEKHMEEVEGTTFTSRTPYHTIKQMDKNLGKQKSLGKK